MDLLILKQVLLLMMFLTTMVCPLPRQEAPALLSVPTELLSSELGCDVWGCRKRMFFS